MLLLPGAQGNIYDVPHEVLFYGEAARRPGVLRVGEVGFNAGHSALVFLWSNAAVNMTSFDLGDLAWTSSSVEFVKAAYPGRMEYVKGLSTDTVPAYTGAPFDLFAVDGNHDSTVPYTDMVNGQRVTRPGGYILIDDWSSTFTAVQKAWARVKREGIVREIECVDQGVVVSGVHKGYCLGTYAA